MSYRCNETTNTSAKRQEDENDIEHKVGDETAFLELELKKICHFKLSSTMNKQTTSPYLSQRTKLNKTQNTSRKSASEESSSK